MHLLVPRFAADEAVVQAVLDVLLASGIVSPIVKPRLVETGESMQPSKAAGAVAAFAAMHDYSGGTPVEFPRIVGIASLEWPRRSALVLVDFDEYLVRPIWGEWRWGNTIVIDLPLDDRTSQERTTLYEDLFARLASAIAPAYAFAAVNPEWNARHVRSTDSLVETIDLDLRGATPPVFWLAYVPRSNVTRSVTTSINQEAVIEDGPRGLAFRTRRDPRSWRSGLPEAERIRELLGAIDGAHPYLTLLGVPATSPVPLLLGS